MFDTIKVKILNEMNNRNAWNHVPDVKKREFASSAASHSMTMMPFSELQRFDATMMVDVLQNNPKFSSL